ncbi:MAG: RNA polymerase factor sigma-54 [Neisseria sp.]|nr:RNA polymerase factor sigma-54 [Neisseria sp.]
MSRLSAQLNLKQTQQLNQSLQQALRVLQMSAIELESEVSDWLADNPLLERVANENHEHEWQHNQRIREQNYAARSAGGDEAEDIWATIADSGDFKTFLHQQVCEHPLNAKLAQQVHVLIDFLDDKGYLPDDLSTVLEHTPLSWQLDEEALQTALDALQQFEPAGVGASDVQESLLLQLSRLPASETRQCAAKIVAHQFHQFKHNKHQQLTRLINVLPEYSAECIAESLALIANLNPYPAYGFAEPEPLEHIAPDVWVFEQQGVWQVSSNPAAQVQIELNSELKQAFDEFGMDATWRERLQDARQKIDFLQQRQNTVLRLVQYIVQKQEDFFWFGETALQPLLMKQAASDLDLAESTISRAANQKYLACPRGVFALRYFFIQAVSAQDGQDGISQQAALALLQSLIECENKIKPLSDQALVDALAKQGINIARRTVAKYREMLHIPAASQRKNR